MEIRRTVQLRASMAEVFEHVDDLAEYPIWMDLVHEVDPVANDIQEDRSWEVELQAQVGPLTRSKRLRMTRTQHDPPRSVTFERDEVDGRRHSPWVLHCELTDIDAPASAASAPSVELQMTLSYGGNLWTGAVLQRVLDDHIERGAAALTDMVGGQATGGEGP